jgi:RNA polymerase sigma-70 factor (ECF subfamily)
MDEQSYILAAQQNPREFKYLYDKYYMNIFLFIYRRTDDEDLAADITQQVFLKAMQSINKYTYRGLPFSAWLYRIASNELIQYFRDNSKQRVISLDKTDIAEMMEDAAHTNDTEKMEQLFIAMKKLKHEELELIEMRFFEKRSFKEIGDIKEMTENNAKVKVYRILDRLKSFFTIEA